MPPIPLRTSVKPAEIIARYYRDHPKARQILLDHSRKVCHRALEIARRLAARGEEVDIQFVAEAAMLHDIGMLRTDAPDLGCVGSESYMRHGVLGRKILEQEGLPRHALVCERHIGVGLTAADIRAEQLPLPQRDMRPQSVEEEIICYADLFFSKNPQSRDKTRSIAAAREKVASFGEDQAVIFDRWAAHFEAPAG